MSENKVTLNDQTTGKSIELPVLKGTQGDPTLDIKQLHEVAYLLLNGNLPNANEMDEFDHDITYHSMVHEKLRV